MSGRAFHIRRSVRFARSGLCTAPKPASHDDAEGYHEDAREKEKNVVPIIGKTQKRQQGDERAREHYHGVEGHKSSIQVSGFSFQLSGNSRFNDDDEFAANRVPFLQGLRKLGGSAGLYLFMNLRQFAGDRDAAFWRERLQFFK